MNPTQVPVFPSSDFDATAAFYGLFGFEEGARFGDEYLIIEHAAGIELHFFGAGRVRSTRNDHAVYIRFGSVEPVDALHSVWATLVITDEFERLKGRIGRLVEPSDTDYGLREFALVDRDGNLLRVGGAIAAAPSP